MKQNKKHMENNSKIIHPKINQTRKSKFDMQIELGFILILEEHLL